MRYPPSAVITNCTLFNNDASDKGGGLYAYNSSTGPTVRNCAIVDNVAAGGGGVHCTNNSGLKLVNCTIASNQADTGGGAIRLSNSAISVTNCILWGNLSTTGTKEIHLSGGNSPTVTYSDVEGGYAGTGNINSDPLFLSDGYHLSSTSPCIDVGDPSGTYTGQTDIDGDSRVIDISGKGDGTVDVDMGADEYKP